MRAALIMADFPWPKCLLNILLGTQAFIKPAINNPNNNQGLASALRSKKFITKAVNCSINTYVYFLRLCMNYKNKIITTISRQPFAQHDNLALFC